MAQIQPDILFQTNNYDDFVNYLDNNELLLWVSIIDGEVGEEELSINNINDYAEIRNQLWNNLISFRCSTYNNRLIRRDGANFILIRIGFN